MRSRLESRYPGRDHPNPGPGRVFEVIPVPVPAGIKVIPARSRPGCKSPSRSGTGLAETNVDKINKDLYKLSADYSSEYLSKIEDKSKGSGLALYIKNDYNFIAIEEFSSCNPNIESLFVKLTNTAAPITVGIICRPPNGNLVEFNKEFENIILKLPEKKTAMY